MKDRKCPPMHPPDCLRRFARDVTYDGRNDSGFERMIEKAASNRSTSEKKEVVAFFQSVRAENWPSWKLNKLFSTDETYFVVKPAKINAVLELIIEKLQASIRSDREEAIRRHTGMERPAARSEK